MPPDARGDWPEEPLRLWESLPEPDRKAVLSAVSLADWPGVPRRRTASSARSRPGPR